MNSVITQEITDRYALYNGDSSIVLNKLPERSIDLAVFSPPFGNVYAYSATEQDLGNVRNDDEFWEHFKFISAGLMRVMRPGRIICCHVANLPTFETRDGVTGIKDFRGAAIRHFIEAGFIFQSEVTIDKNPQAQAIRHHPKGLLFVQLGRDSSWMRMALADYVLMFRTPGRNDIPVKTDLTHQEWIEYARPIWTGLRETDVLPVLAAKDEEDERHLCPLQLPVIERCVRLYSNVGETVLSPFAGVGSEIYQSLKLKRNAVAIELKPSYFRVMQGNARKAVYSEALPLFADLVGAA